MTMKKLNLIDGKANDTVHTTIYKKMSSIRAQPLKKAKPPCKVPYDGKRSGKFTSRKGPKS